MKKTFFTISLLIISILFSLNSYAAGEYNLKYNLKKGDVFKHTSSIDMKINMNAIGQDMDILMNVETTIAITVINVKNKVYDLEYRYVRFKTSTNNSFMPITIDTDNPDDGGLLAEASNILKAIIDIPIIAKIDKFGNIISIERVDNLQQAIIDALNKSDNIMVKQMAELTFKQQFSEKSMKESFEQSFIAYPENPIKIGDSWNVVSARALSGIDVKFNMNHTLKALKDNIATIESTGTVENEDTSLETPQGTIKYAIKGKILNTTQVNLKNGMTVSGENSMEFDILMDMQGMEIPMKLSAKGVLKCEN